MPLDDVDSLLQRNLAVCRRAVSFAVEFGIIRLVFLEHVVDGGQQHSGDGDNRFLVAPALFQILITVKDFRVFLLRFKDSKKLVEALESGKLVIAIMAPGHFTTTGHFIVLRGITEEGNVLVADPASVKRSNQEWPLPTVVNEAASRAGAGGPFWVFSR